MKTSYLNKVFALAFSFAIISLLIISGPAQAFMLSLSADSEEVEAGDYVTYDINLKLESADGILNIQKIVLSLDGPVDRECSFDVNGNKLAGNLCENIIAINRVDTTTHYGYGYGYGYGYSNGELRYKVIINTEGFYAGDYTPTIKVMFAETSSRNQETKIGNILTINPSTISEDEDTNRRIIIRDRIGEEGNTISITPSSEYDFNYKDYAHELTVNNINEDSVDLTIHSDPQNVNVQIPTENSVDIDQDGVADATLDLWYIGKDSATIHITSEETIKFNERITEKQEIIDLESNKIKNYLHENSVEELTFNSLLFGSSLLNTILVITNAIIFLLVVVAFIIRRR